jgi:hypothetical protein
MGKLTLTIIIPNLADVKSLADLQRRTDELNAIMSWVASKPSTVILEEGMDESSVRTTVVKPEVREIPIRNVPKGANPPIGKRNVDLVIKVLQSEHDKGNTTGLTRHEVLDRLYAIGWTTDSKQPPSMIATIVSNRLYAEFFTVNDGRFGLTEKGLAHLRQPNMEDMMNGI